MLAQSRSKFGSPADIVIKYLPAFARTDGLITNWRWRVTIPPFLTLAAAVRMGSSEAAFSTNCSDALIKHGV